MKVAFQLAVGANAIGRLGQKSLTEDMPEQACYKGMGEAYVGLKSDTSTGLRCMKWIDVDSAQMNGLVTSVQVDGSKVNLIKGEANNYCRNLDASPDGPWCYPVNQKDPKALVKEACGVPKCDPKGPFGKEEGWFPKAAAKLKMDMSDKDLNCKCADALYGSTTTTKDTSVSFLQNFLRECPCAKTEVAKHLKPVPLLQANKKKGDCDCITGAKEGGDCDCITGKKEKAVSAVAVKKESVKKGDCDCISGNKQTGDCDCITGKKEVVSAVKKGDCDCITGAKEGQKKGDCDCITGNKETIKAVAVEKEPVKKSETKAVKAVAAVKTESKKTEAKKEEKKVSAPVKVEAPKKEVAAVVKKETVPKAAEKKEEASSSKGDCDCIGGSKQGSPCGCDDNKATVTFVQRKGPIAVPTAPKHLSLANSLAAVSH